MIFQELLVIPQVCNFFFFEKGLKSVIFLFNITSLIKIYFNEQILKAK